MKWYVVNVYSGFEQRVLDAIYDAAKKRDLSSMFGEILIPKEEVVEIKKGEKVKSERKFFPGYILVQMTLTDETWHLVRGISKVSGFLGARGKPLPLSTAEVQRIMKRVEDSANNIKVFYQYAGKVSRALLRALYLLYDIVELLNMAERRVSLLPLRRVAPLFFSVELVEYR